jgi:hypothetical protein
MLGTPSIEYLATCAPEGVHPAIRGGADPISLGTPLVGIRHARAGRFQGKFEVQIPVFSLPIPVVGQTLCLCLPVYIYAHFCHPTVHTA